MTVKIAIIGLGQIGASIGLALTKHKDQVSTIGYDSSSGVSRQAQKLGAVESTAHNLHGAVKEADMVVLALPLDQVNDALRSIALHIHEQTVVFDTAPVKTAVAAWAEEHLHTKGQYVGLTPAIASAALESDGSGITAARADLFQNSLVAVTAPYATQDWVVKLATSFVSLLGARAYFADLAEVDGILATVHTMPSLAAFALAETVIGQPGWADIRKLAGRPFAAGLQPMEAEPAGALAEAAQQNRLNTVRVLDDFIVTLQSLRDAIDRNDKENLQARLENDLNKANQWRRVRADGDWQSIEMVEQEIPTFSDLWMQQLGLGKLLGLGNKKPKKK